MNYFLIAGEASGDMHAANLIHALREQDPQTHFVGLGGDKMRDAGCHLLQDYRKMAYMGVIAVLKNLRQVRANFRIAEQGLLDERPDALILIDYPSFNLKIAQFCRQHLPATKIIYYIPPKVWAWKTHRVHRIARLSDAVLGIFPFEPAFYAQYGYHCTYVGNPTMAALRNCAAASSTSGAIALLPGSRRSEIAHCLPTMLRAAQKVAQTYQASIVVTAAPGIEDEFYRAFMDKDCVLTRDTYEVLQTARAAVVNSGTATLETAIIGCPQTAVYHIACSKWLGWLKPFIFKIPHFTLVNIIPGKEVIRELIAYDFSERKIVEELTRLMTDEPYRQQMLRDYAEIRTILGDHPTAQTAAQHIIQTLQS